jgi:membrane-associated phospholipid phosphatase
MVDQARSKLAICAPWVWLTPLIPLALAAAIFQGELQTHTFVFLNNLTQSVPDTIWAWLTFLGNGWGIFAICFPLLVLAPRLLSAGIIAGAMSAIASSTLKSLFDLPRPANVLSAESFYRIGEPLLHRAFPSGHTLTVFAIASALYFSCHNQSRRPLLWLFALASLGGLSRNALGAHWLTDVLGGAGFGIWCGMIGAVLVQYIPEEQLILTKIWPRIIAIGGVVAMYFHLTKTIDLVHNLPLQYASVALVSLTLVFFIKAQFVKSE